MPRAFAGKIAEIGLALRADRRGVFHLDRDGVKHPETFRARRLPRRVSA
jgi:hypothetical protein